MFEKKRIVLQQKRIEELENIISRLEKENSFLSSKIENDKNKLLLRKNELDERESIISKREEELNFMLDKLRIIRDNYEKIISDMNKVKADFEKTAKQEIDRIRNKK